MHHIISNGWSLGIFFRELPALYEAFSKGEPSPLPVPRLQYADFAVWQRQWLRGETLERQFSYWIKQLEGFPLYRAAFEHLRPPVRLIADQDRPSHSLKN